MPEMWHYGEPQDGILWVRIDREDRPVNTLSRAGLEELEGLIGRVDDDSSIQGIVFQSGKPGNFIAGADVTELKDLEGVSAARDMSRYGQKVFRKLDKLSVTTVALISGACLGGGLEFALACDYRLADNEEKTLLGLPEVKLGLIPGWGGTVRLPKLIGLPQALPMILTGKMLNGRQAKSKGVVHDVVPPEGLPFAAEKIVRTGGAGLVTERRSFVKRTLEDNRLSGKLALWMAERQTRKTTHGHYPAPEAAIQSLRTGLTATRKEAFASEAETIAQLSENAVTRELIRLFFLQEEAKKPPAWLDETVPSDSLSRAAVVGAGTMGAGVALLLARKGVWTRMKDLKPEMVSAGMKTIRKLVNKEVRRKRITPLQATRALDRISPTTEYTGMKRADVVIEAIVEDLEIKKQVFRDLAEATSPETVLATNTSSLRVSEIAAETPHPERVVGLHFFNPPDRMPLVEVIRTEQTSPQALAKAVAVAQRLGKTMVVAGDCPGFLVNRLLAPYMNEAGYLLAEVEDPLEIDRAAVEFGMPMGPLELTDLVGVDVAGHVARNMHDAYGERMEPAPLWKHIERAREQGKRVTLLQKPRPFGRWRKKQVSTPVASAIGEMRREQRGQTRSLQRKTIIERLILPIVNEAACCLEEGIVERPEDIDVAMVFGAGFAPFRGGPLRYADSAGIGYVVERLKHLGEKHPRLTPTEALQKRADEGRSFLEPVEEEQPSAVA